MQRFKNILCVVEHAKLNKAAIERAVSLAENNQANLTVVSAAPRMNSGINMPRGGPISAELQSTLNQTYHAALTTQTKPYLKRCTLQTRVLVGTAFLEIIREVLHNKHDLVIKAAEEHDWLDRLFSSDDMHLLRKCPCPVWLIKPKHQDSYQRILAAIDVDHNYPEDELESRLILNRQIMEMASSVALAETAEFHVVSVWDSLGESIMNTTMTSTPEDEIEGYVRREHRQIQENMDSLVESTINKLGNEARKYIQPFTHLIKGNARQEIPILARKIDADLVVMGTVARTGIPGFIMGNTAETILTQIDCSLLAVKPPGFITPVTLDSPE